MEMPYLSAWTMARTNLRRSATPVRECQGFVGLPPRLPDLDVLQGAHQLLGQRTLAVLGRPGHRRVEAQARLDGDRHLVQGVGQLQRDLLAAFLAPAVQQQLGQEVADDRDDDADQDGKRTGPCSCDVEQAERREKQRQAPAWRPAGAPVATPADGQPGTSSRSRRRIELPGVSRRANGRQPTGAPRLGLRERSICRPRWVSGRVAGWLRCAAADGSGRASRAQASRGSERLSIAMAVSTMWWHCGDSSPSRLGGAIRT